MRPGVDYFIERLDATHQTNRFSMGPDLDFRPLKSFLTQHALSYQSANVAVTYVAALPAIQGERPRVIGYISLTCSEVDLGGMYALEDCQHANRYPSMPALKIARLACHSDYRGRRVGEALVDLAIALAADHIGPTVGCRFLVTDSKARSVSFYERAGFTLLETEENQARAEPVMFLDLNKLDLDPANDPALPAQTADGTPD
ncbi:hypothetical protein APB20_02530 [Pseudomonas aeruginosa]|nr:hypothetical protein APB20_02530 [Pseudomonas aeruginosa]